MLFQFMHQFLNILILTILLNFCTHEIVAFGTNLVTINRIANAKFYSATKSCKPLTMSLVGKSSFLGDKSEDIYLSTCLKRSIDACQACLADDLKIIEVEFPAQRKSDLSLAETLFTNSKFLKEFVKTWSSYGKDLWVIFPDPKVRELICEFNFKILYRF